MIRTATTLARFADSGDGEFWEERGTFVSGDGLWLVHRLPDRRFLWSRFIVSGIIPGSSLFGGIRGSEGPRRVVVRGELCDQRRVLLEREGGGVLAVRTHL
jgi:hypothetical protein